jgi:hypothetical protein
MRALAVTLLAGTAFLAAAQTVPAQMQPAPAESPAAAAGSPLPEIGRTRATSAACTAMRDLVIPAFAAARRADMRFAETQQRLPKYGTIVADPWDRSTVVREAALARLSSDAATLLQEAQQISKLLGDPRLSKDVTDPAVVAERTQLQEIYAAQQTRAAILSEFVQRESMTTSRANVGMEDGGGLNSKMRLAAQNVDALPGTPMPAATRAPAGQPLMNSEFPVMNKATLNDWGNTVAKLVRDKENAAAKTFLPLAQACH